MTVFKFNLKASITAAACAAAVTLAGSVGAQAADLGGSIKDEPVYQEAPRLQKWTGFYLGANLGGAWSDADAHYRQVGGPLFKADMEASSVIGGGQIGYNWQAGSLVVGIEADLAAQHLDATAVGVSVSNPNDTVTGKSSSKWLGTVRPRIGYAAGNWLLYATGGLAYGHTEHSLIESRTNIPGATRSFSDSSTKVGWTVGAGIEWSLTRNWTLGAEYLHVDLGSTRISTDASIAGGVAFPASSARFEDREDIVRAKLNYKF